MTTERYHDIRYEPGRVARVILSRPAKRNAQSWRLLREMDQAFTAAMEDDECRVIVLSGAGTSFSGGHDLDSEDQVSERETFDRQAGSFRRSERYRDIYLDSHLRWRNLTKPTVAMVQGYCVFGGWMIAAAMDVIIAAEDALFIPVYGDYFTASWDVGARKAKEILFENRFMTAAEARDCGFVSRVAPADRLEETVLAFAARVAENEPELNRIIKFAINQTLDLMGFSASVRSLSPAFDNQIRRPRSAAPADGGPPPRDPLFRDRVRSARDYLRRDNRS
jgi:enoyl-CoA hydratase